MPQKVLDALVTSQPAQTCERAWWVMFYSIASRNCTMSELLADDLKASRLENNLWMSINDIGFLLQPSILNVQAIITMVVSAERCMLPQACWSLISKASTMLLGLGVGKPPQTSNAVTGLLIYRQHCTHRLGGKKAARCIILAIELYG